MTAPAVVEVEPARFGDVIAHVRSIDDAARAIAGHAALGDAVWLDLEHPGADSAGFLAGDLAYGHVARVDTQTERRWSLGVVVAPEARELGVRPALVAAAVAHVAARGGGLVTLWVLGAGPADEAELAAAGWRADRELYEMRVALPVAARPKWPTGIHLRHFEPGRDEKSWLAVNNRAFAGHAEQGNWTLATLERRESEPWFDPELFLLAADDGGLLGFNWLKVHDANDVDSALGEIYVIGVDPRGQGSGVGRALAIAGLEALYERRVTTGMLFCAADNGPALRLYKGLGFEVHRVDRAYELEVRPQ